MRKPLFLLLLVLCVQSRAETLPRRLDFGWALATPAPGAVGAEVTRVSAGAGADLAGVRAGDRVLRVGNVKLDGEAGLAAARFVTVPGRPVAVELQRGSQQLNLRVTPTAAARESHPGIDTEWGAIAGPGALRLRTILTMPRGPVPHAAVFIVGWLSCDSVEIPPQHRDSTAQLLQDVVEHSGSAVLRIDKPGTGDSEGVCARTDFADELEGYRRAYAAMARDGRVNPRRIVVMGISNGGGVAPLVVSGAQPAGYITIDGWSKTWFEHMLDLERRRLVLSGTRPEAVNVAMAGLSEFYAKYLLEQLTPAEVLMRRPDLTRFWYDKGDSQYGRPASFYHQLQGLDLAAAWGRVRVPTLVVWGEFDWIMDRSDQDQIVRLVNSDGSNRARLLVVPGADHNFASHADPQQAFDHGGDGRYPVEAAQAIIQFIKSVTSSGAN
jgi:pimeloyl-ACP methyl ester carboxylesterase